MKGALAVIAVTLIASCTQRVVETTSEVRPSRYAVLEFTRQRIDHNLAVDYAKRAVAAEQLKLQPGDTQGGVVMAGPARFPAQGDLPALEATVTINTVTSGNETKFRIFASSVVPQNVVGGVDARLADLAQRLARHIEQMIAR